MRVRVLPSVAGGSSRKQYSISTIIDDTLAIDAGCIGLLSPIARQRAIRHVFLSHVHWDHIASLPLFLDNVYQIGDPSVEISASADTWDALQKHVFNDRLWPDLVRLSNEESPFFRAHTLEANCPVVADGFTVTPVALDHVIPTYGFLVEDESTAVAFVSDTGPTKDVWSVINDTSKISAVFMECSFPNSHRWLAEKSAHLCPSLFAAELEKIDPPRRIIATHLKPSFHDEIAIELKQLPGTHVEVVSPDTEYIF